MSRNMLYETSRNKLYGMSKIRILSSTIVLLPYKYAWGYSAACCKPRLCLSA